MAQQFQFLFTNFVCIITGFTSTNITSIFCNNCLVFKRFRISRKRITWFISVIISQTSCCFSVIFAVFKKNVHWHYNIHSFCIANLYTINFWNAVDKWCVIFKRNTCFFLHYLVL